MRWIISEQPFSCWRHLKHKHVLELLGAIKKKLPRYDYKYVFVMPRCKGNLRKIIFEDNEANPTKSNNFNDATMMYFKWAKQIADGLKYIHDRGLVHRHLKLENIMVCMTTQNNMRVQIWNFFINWTFHIWSFNLTILIE